MDTIGERFDYARKQKGLSYREIGDLLKITGDAVRKSSPFMNCFLLYKPNFLFIVFPNPPNYTYYTNWN